MKKLSVSYYFAAMGFALLVTGCESTKGGVGPGPGEQEATSSSGTSTGGPITTGPNRISSGAVGDTLNTCLDRIPGDATAGQRMLAEKSCHRDDQNRQYIQKVPGQ